MAPEVIADEPRSTNPVTSSGQHEPSKAVMSCCKVRKCSSITIKGGPILFTGTLDKLNLPADNDTEFSSYSIGLII